MKRWNISSIFFLGTSGRCQEIPLTPGEVNIITGASGTGKSTIIKAIDYCLGSSRCELPIHARRKSEAVGVKWERGSQQIIVGRLVPKEGAKSSSTMFVSSGTDLQVPQSVEEFDGATTLNAAKSFLEQIFGIGDIGSNNPDEYSDKSRATIRQITPYLFVTKEVIDSERVLLHGLEDQDKVKGIISSMPYFLGAADNSSFQKENKLRQLEHILAKAEAQQKAHENKKSALKERLENILNEAARVNLAMPPNSEESEDTQLDRVKEIAARRIHQNVSQEENQLGSLHDQRRQLLSELSSIRRQVRAIQTAKREAVGFDSSVTRQHHKLKLAEHFKLDSIHENCPLCNTPSIKGKQTAQALNNALKHIRSESDSIARVKPKLVQHESQLIERESELKLKINNTDSSIRSIIRQEEETKQLNDLAQAQAHLLGRISFFLETHVDENKRTQVDLEALKSEIENLTSEIDPEAKKLKLQHAETKISTLASEIIKKLPTVAPCYGAELLFSSKKPEISIIESETSAILKMPDVGSDQNFLAIHLALSFALQHFFEIKKSPIPGVLILDQISRPYFPSNGRDTDVKEITDQHEDEEVQAMRQHIDFLFKEVAERDGLQVILIEHAYFADDPRYVSATKQRWTRASGKALIPLDWPNRQKQ